MKPSAPTLVLGCTVCILLGTVEAVWQLTCGTVLDRLAERMAAGRASGGRGHLEGRHRALTPSGRARPMMTRIGA